MSTELVVVGAVNVDLVVAAPRLPGPGETVVGPGVERHGGGKGANAAVAAARAGARVHLVGAVGDDDTGRGALDELAEDGVGVDHVARLARTPTGVALIVVDPAGENQIAVGAGANAALTVAHVVAALTDLLPRAGCVLVSTEIPVDTAVAAVRAARAAGVRCILNPAPVVPGLVDALADGVIVTPNRTELADLVAHIGPDGGASDDVAASVDSRGPDGSDAATRLRALTGAPVVVTLGGDGALVADGAEVVRLPARPATVRDTTGAGDTFNGVLAAGLASGRSVAASVDDAMVAAAISVGAVGARAGMPDAATIATARR